MKKRKQDKRNITVETHLKDIVILIISMLIMSFFITQSLTLEYLAYSLIFFIVTLTFIVYFMVKLSKISK